MAAHRYWRLLARRTNTNESGTNFSVNELSFRNSSDVDLSVGGSAISSPEVNASFPASQAFDKSTATHGFVSAADLPAWIGYDHVNPVDVASVLFTVATTQGFPSLNGVLLQWSDDGVAWFSEGSRLIPNIESPAVGNVVRFTPYYGGTQSLRSLQYILGRQSAPTSQQTPRGISDLRLPAHVDIVDGGKFKAVVYTDVNALPADQPVAPRHVRLHDFDGQGRLVRSGWSEMVGGQAVCVFENIRQGNYYAVGFDHTGAYDAEVAANLPLEPM